MRLHCKAVATKADKTSSNSKFLAWREETGCQQTDLHFCCWHETDLSEWPDQFMLFGNLCKSR